MSSSIKPFIFVLAAVSIASSPALAQTATFDDLPSLTTVPPDYALPGSIWSNWAVADQTWLQTTYNAGKEACAISTPNCGWNNGGLPAAISRATPFDFTGGYFMAWADGACGLDCPMTLVVTGYNGATVVGTSTDILSPSTPQWFAFNFSNVDNVTFNTQLYNGGFPAWYLADNLVFNQNTSAVPEPESMMLFGTGLVALYGAARRRRNKQL